MIEVTTMGLEWRFGVNGKDMASERNELGIIAEAFQKISADRIDYILTVISEVIYFRWKNYIQEKKKQEKYHFVVYVYIF